MIAGKPGPIASEIGQLCETGPDRKAWLYFLRLRMNL
jgi:hypothetical protein